MANRVEQEKVGKEKLLRKGVHNKTCGDTLSEEERRVLYALRDPVKGPRLLNLMNKD